MHNNYYNLQKTNTEHTLQYKHKKHTNTYNKQTTNDIRETTQCNRQTATNNGRKAQDKQQLTKAQRHKPQKAKDTEQHV